jgi:hypothetical protein
MSRSIGRYGTYLPKVVPFQLGEKGIENHKKHTQNLKIEETSSQVLLNQHRTDV